MSTFCEVMGPGGSAAPRQQRDLIVMHDGGGGHGGGHGGHGGGWDGGGWGGDGGGWNWGSRILFVLILAYIVLTALGVIGH